jgi:hypothetical protein
MTETTESLDAILRLVAEGKLSAEEAAPVIDALQLADEAVASAVEPDAEPNLGGRPRALRVEVSEHGRRVVNLRVPLSIGRMALDHIPGLSGDSVQRIREALEHGMTGPILVVDEDSDGSGVRIVLE